MGTAPFGAVFNVSVFGRAHTSSESVQAFDPSLVPAIALALHHIFEIGVVLAIAILVLAATLPSGLGAARAKAA